MTVSELIDILQTFKQDEQVYHATSEYGGFVLDIIDVIETEEPVSYYLNNGNKVTNVTKCIVIY